MREETDRRFDGAGNLTVIAIPRNGIHGGVSELKASKNNLVPNPARVRPVISAEVDIDSFSNGKAPLPLHIFDGEKDNS